MKEMRRELVEADVKDVDVVMLDIGEYFFLSSYLFHSSFPNFLLQRNHTSHWKFPDSRLARVRSVTNLFSGFGRGNCMSDIFCEGCFGKFDFLCLMGLFLFPIFFFFF
jgi:hypothetical protein